MPNETDGKAVDAGETAEGIGLEAARATLGDLVLRAGFGNERISISRHGKPIAALVSIRDLDRLRDLDLAPAG